MKIMARVMYDVLNKLNDDILLFVLYIIFLGEALVVGEDHDPALVVLEDQEGEDHVPPSFPAEASYQEEADLSWVEGAFLSSPQEDHPASSAALGLGEASPFDQEEASFQVRQEAFSLEEVHDLAFAVEIPFALVVVVASCHPFLVESLIEEKDLQRPSLDRSILKEQR